MNQDVLYDAVVVGGGAGWIDGGIISGACALPCTGCGERPRFGGQITITAEVVNYPGVERDQRRGR